MPAAIAVVNTARFVPGATASATRRMPLDVKQHIYKKTLRSLAKRAGIPRVRRSCYRTVERRVAQFVERVLRRANHYRQHQQTATLSRAHLAASLARERHPMVLYGKQ